MSDVGTVLMVALVVTFVAAAVFLTRGNKRNYPAPEGSEEQLRKILGYVINNTNFDWRGARITDVSEDGHILTMEFPQSDGSKYTHNVHGPMEIYMPATQATYCSPFGGPYTVELNNYRRVRHTSDPLVIKIGNELAKERQRKRQERWKRAKGPWMEIE